MFFGNWMSNPIDFIVIEKNNPPDNEIKRQSPNSELHDYSIKYYFNVF